MNKLKSYGPLFVIVAALLWSFDGILRRNLYSLPPSVVVFYEHLLGALLLIPFFRFWTHDLKQLSRKQWIAIAVVALFSGALGTIFYTAALGKVNYIQYSIVVLLQQLQPIWAIGTAALLLKERVTKRFLIWAFLALIAAYFITFKNLSVSLTQNAETAIAGLLALGAGLLWGSSTAISKYVLKDVSFLTATALRFFLAPVFAFGLIAFLGQTSALSSLTQAQWLNLMLITLSTGLMALALYYFGLKHTPARVTTLLELVWPASAVLIDYFYFHNGLSLTQIGGILLLLICIRQVSRYKT